MALANTQYESIMRSYGEKQAKARRELDARLERIEESVPELSALEHSITALQAGKVRASIEGDAAKLKELTEALTAAQRERSALLAARGISPADLEPVYECPDCRDTGYIGEEKCHCFLQAEIDLLYHQSHLKEILAQENFDTFSYFWYDEADRDVMKRNVMEARLFIESFDTSFQNLLLLGDVGTGKTFLSNCIAKELMDTCHSVVYLTAFELFELLSRNVFGMDRRCPKAL